MLPKTPAFVGCAHCQTLGATAACPLCGRMICASCQERGRCPTPTGPRELRLGLGRRLRGVDPAGRLGWYNSVFDADLHLVDLDTGKILEEPLQVSTTDPLVLLGALALVPAERRLILSETLQGVAITEADLETGLARNRLEVRWPGNFRPTELARPKVLGISEDGDRLLLELADQSYRLLRLDRKSLSSTLERPRRTVFHCAVLSTRLDLCAIGSFNEVVFYRTTTGERLGRRELGSGDVHPLAAAAGRIAVVADSGDLEVLDHDAKRRPSQWSRCYQSRLEPLPWHSGGALSPGGQLLAVAQGRTVEVRSVDHVSERQILTGHTDHVILVRFVRDGRILVTADEDNRVMLWPVEGGRVLTG